MLQKPLTANPSATAKRTGIAALVVSSFGLATIASDEAFRAAAYQDLAGIWTVGYGETLGTKPTSRTTPERALGQLVVRVEAHAQGVRQCVKADLFQREFDAYVSLAYNIGVQGFCASSIPALLNAGQYGQACDRLATFNKARVNGGQLIEVRGLTLRRLRERAACLGEGFHV